jgi:hypothetical protein
MVRYIANVKFKIKVLKKCDKKGFYWQKQFSDFSNVIVWKSR